MGEEADPSTMGRAGVTLRPPMVVLRSIGGGIDMVGDFFEVFAKSVGADILSPYRTMSLCTVPYLNAKCQQ